MTMTNEEIQALQARVQEAFQDYDDASPWWVALHAADRMRNSLAEAPPLCADLLAARAENDALRAEVARLREALTPLRDRCNEVARSHDTDCTGVIVKIGDLRRARTAMEDGK